MKLTNLFAAGLIGLSGLSGTAEIASAQSTLKIMRGATAANIKVSLNRAIVMESDESFAELSVANPGVADVAALSDRTIYVLGKAPGRTTLTLLGADGRLLTNVEVHVSPDLAEFKERLREILPKERIDVRTANDGIVLSGVATGTQSLARAVELAERYAPGRVTNLLTVGGSHQVMLKVRFAEMNRSVVKNLTSSIGVAGAIGGNGVIAGTGQVAQGDNLANLVAGEALLSTTSRQGAFSYGFTAGGLAINVMLEALETKGMARTLAEPNLVASSGAEASFLAGGEFPIPVRNDDGIGVDYRPFGILLNFVPTVLNDDVINLQIETEVSEPDTANVFQLEGYSIPAFIARRASTVVQMKDGQSIAIAGLLQDDFTDLASQVPWLGDVPVLGALFRSSNYERQQSELVIIVTPHLITPVDGNSLVLPTDRIRIPSESEFFLLGKTAGNKGDKAKRVGSDAASVTSQDFKGSYGYVLE